MGTNTYKFSFITIQHYVFYRLSKILDYVMKYTFVLHSVFRSISFYYPAIMRMTISGTYLEHRKTAE